MNRILLADDSPHAQRMGERILRDEGYEVVSVTDGETALLRMRDVDPDVILADVFLPGRSGLDICSFVKTEAAHQHVRVVLTAGMLETFDEGQARAAGADAIIKKPFEASVVLDTIRPLVAAARAAKEPRPDLPVEPATPPATFDQQRSEPAPVRLAVVSAETERSLGRVAELKPAAPVPPPDPKLEDPFPQPTGTRKPVIELKRPAAGPVPEPDPEPDLLPSGTGVSEEELLRAAVTLALDAAFPALVDDITAKVLRNLRAGTGDAGSRDDEPGAAPVPAAPFLNDLSE